MSLAFLACFSLSAAMTTQCELNESFPLFALDGDASDSFGAELATFQDIAVITSYADDDKGNDAGAAYVYRFNGTSWSFEQKLTASDGKSQDNFGVSVSCTDQRIAIGTYRSVIGVDTFSGAIYVYRFDGIRWNEEQKLELGKRRPYDGFGSAVSMDKDIVAVGAYYDDEISPGAGAAYVFRFEGGQWVKKQKLLSSQSDPFDYFGYAVGLSGDLVLIGSPNNRHHRSIGAGSATLFRETGGAWLAVQRMIPRDPVQFGQFGSALALNKDFLVIGAYGSNVSGERTGAAYVYRFFNGHWAETQKLFASDGENNDLFGYSVSLGEDYLALGALGVDDGCKPPQDLCESGAAYVFRREGTLFHELTKLAASDAEFRAGFATVGVTGATVVVGAREADGSGVDTGKAYGFEIPAFVLDVEPEQATAGDEVQLSHCGGTPFAPAMLAVVELNGVSTFAGVAVGAFDAAGAWELKSVVPPGLGTLEVELQSFSVDALGVGTSSNRVALELN